MTVSFLVDGERVLIDECDLLKVAGLTWHLHRTVRGKVYVRARVGRTRIYLHRHLLNAPPGLEVDHWNDNGLDNRKANLRVCTTRQNGWNKGRQRNNASGFTGVAWQGRRWRAQYQHRGRTVWLGSFDTPEQAHTAYLAAVAPLRGEFLRTA